MSLIGYHAVTNRPVELEVARTITSVDELISEPQGAPLIAPGWIDLQVNGYFGCDYNSPDATDDAIDLSIKAQIATGVTRFYPTVITGPPDDMTGALRNLAAAKQRLPLGRAMEGFHVEGPHISPEEGPRGAHPAEWVRAPHIDEYRRWQEAADGEVRLVTLAPEWPESSRYIETLVAEGVVVSIGHTQATTEQIAEAVRAGATMSTHLGNGCASMMSRRHNCLWDQLAEDRLAAGFIVDGIHLSTSFLKTALRAKGADRSILVTDAVVVAGCQPGRHRLGVVELELRSDGRVTLADKDRLAGSALRMDHAIENVIRLAGTSLPEAITMATRNPARVGRIAGRLRGLAPGDRADIVELEYDDETQSLRVLRTFLDGEVVYQAPE
jgi:N-acetylglucosamine-6-phosphate deacetylase